jgi:hypothetical protein
MCGVQGLVRVAMKAEMFPREHQHKDAASLSALIPCLVLSSAGLFESICALAPLQYR